MPEFVTLAWPGSLTGKVTETLQTDHPREALSTFDRWLYRRCLMIRGLTIESVLLVGMIARVAAQAPGRYGPSDGRRRRR